jgi:hypothetical protein
VENGTMFHHIPLCLLPTSHIQKENGYNVLKEVTNAMEDEVKTGKALPIHVVDICIEVSEYAKTVSPQFQRTNEVYSWIISWGTGLSLTG